MNDSSLGKRTWKPLKIVPCNSMAASETFAKKQPAKKGDSVDGSEILLTS